MIHEKRLLACSFHSLSRELEFSVGHVATHQKKKKKNFTVQVALMGGLTTELNPGQWDVSLRVTHVAVSGTFFKRQHSLSDCPHLTFSILWLGICDVT